MLLIKQVSVFVENKKGRLAQITKVLGDNAINMAALSIADTTDFGILRMIVNDPEKAEACLKEAGMTVKCTNVIALSVEDRPGALNHALTVLDDHNVNLEYMYAFMGKSGDKALVVLKLDNPELGLNVLHENGFSVLSTDEVYHL